METAQDYYRTHGPMTRRINLDALPTEVPALRDIVQGVLVHADLAQWLYHFKVPDERQPDRNVRPIAQVLERISALDPHPLTVARAPRDRMTVVCRHFSLVLCAMLREQGVPARARCGFGAYFNPGRFEDHWVCEYWNSAQKRWILVDAQLDAAQDKAFKLDFDPLDVPRNRFIIAGDAWQMCRSGRADPDSFGLSLVPNLHGLWFVAGNVVRDLAALNRVEMLPWDVWGLMAMDNASITEEKRELLDRVAALTLAGDEALPQIREIYQTDERLRVPATVFNAMTQRPEAWEAGAAS